MKLQRKAQPFSNVEKPPPERSCGGFLFAIQSAIVL
jgi:hypothetical protein